MWHIGNKVLTDEEFHLSILNKEVGEIDKEDVDTRSASVRVLHSASRKKRDELEKRCMAYIDACVKAGAPVTVKRVAVGAGCSVSFIYKNEKIKDYIKKSGKAKPSTKTKLTKSEKLLIDIANLEKENLALTEKYTTLLKRRIKDYQAGIAREQEIVYELLRGIRDHKYKYIGDMFNRKDEIDENGYLIVGEDSNLWKLE